MADRVMLRRRPSSEILSGESADVYFARAEEILRREGLDPMVTMEVFARQEAVLCGIDEAKILIAHALEKADPDEASVEGLDGGDPPPGGGPAGPGRAPPPPGGRRRRGAAAGDPLRRPPRPPRRHRRARL